MPSLIEQVRHLRPGMTRADVDLLADGSDGLLTAHTLEFSGPTGKMNWGSELPRPCGIRFDEEGVISFISFPIVSPPVSSVREGMSVQDLVKELPQSEEVKINESARKLGVSHWIIAREPDGFVQVATFDKTGLISAVYIEKEAAMIERFVAIQAIQDRQILEKEQAARRLEDEKRARQKAWDEKQEWKRTAPANEVLLDWAGSHSAWGEGSGPWLILANWLISTSTADDRHIIMYLYNWDHGLDLISWIVRQPDTEIATVLELFSRIEDEVGLTYKVWQEGGRPKDIGDLYDLFVEIGDRVRHGFYTHSTNPIGFDGMRRNVAENSDYEEVKRRLIPDAAYNPIIGRTVTVQNYRLKMPVEEALLS